MKVFRIIAAVLLTIIFWQVLQQYFFSTRYDFSSHSPFSGRLIYNPYDSISANQWLKCNFHAHATAWKGFTNGHGMPEDIHRSYDSLGYDVHCVSNYQLIDTVSKNAGIYIPAYEHGYNMTKTHQQVLGSKEICWSDYIFPQLMSNKQDILNRLSSDSNATVILNHPVIRNGYTSKDLSSLSNYHCMEVINPAGNSFAQWDTVLSAGKPVFLVGNDDIHNILKKDRLGRMCTFVSVPANDSKSVLNALKNGESYGVIIGAKQNPQQIPSLKSLQVIGDTIALELDQKAVKIQLTGQNGHLLAAFSDTSSVKYKLKETDHYARISADFENGTSLFLNPVFFTQSSAIHQSPVYVNHVQTLLSRSMGIILAMVWLRWWMILLFGQALPFRIGFSFPALLKRAYSGNPLYGKRQRKRIAW